MYARHTHMFTSGLGNVNYYYPRVQKLCEAIRSVSPSKLGTRGHEWNGVFFAPSRVNGTGQYPLQV